MVWLLIFSIFLTTDTVEVKGTTGLSYRLFVNQDMLCFQYKFGRNWSEPMKLDSGDISEYSVALTTGDYLHIVWCKDSKVCYQTNYKPITPISLKYDDRSAWSERIIISTYYSEPVFNISITINGEYVYVDWLATSACDFKIHEKWRRARWVYDVPNAWEPIECISKLNSNNQKK